jgi:hypothetical protein
MGLINLNDFIIGIQSSWIKRVYQHGADNWRFDLLQKTHGNPFLLNSTLVSRDDHPIISNIAVSFEKFCKIYYETGMNYKKAYILSNPLFVRGRRDNGLLCRQFFGRNLRNDTLEKIATLKLEDFLDRNVIKTLDQLNMDTQLNFTLVEYMRISEAVAFFIDKKKDVPASVPIGLMAFFLSFDKGSKKTRKALAANFTKPNLLNIPSITTFLNITGIVDVAEKTIKSAICFWNFSPLKNTIREFEYKFIFNQLGLNNRVAHFVQNVDKACTFCTLKMAPAPIPEETFLHLFYDCPTTSNIRTMFIRKHFPILVNSPRQALLKFWFLAEADNNTNLFISVAVCTLNFLLWNMKLKKNIVNFSTLEQNWIHILDTLVKQSLKIREAVLLVHYDICRRWHG